MPAPTASACERPRLQVRPSAHRLSAVIYPGGRRARSGCASTHFPEKVSLRFRHGRTDNTALPNASAPAEASAPDALRTTTTIRLVFHPTSHRNRNLSAPRGRRPEIETSRRATSSPARQPPPRCPPIDFPAAAKSHPPPRKRKRPADRILL